ncbi:beta-lactamase family protein, partial [Candidatus Roizmanbacteria bacterium]|nr:beta-lactamase family protein [Candidatus Roizmanbacteria bacterium]
GGNIDENAPQHWGSVSKPFTAECILYLVDKGYMNFGDDILTLCPELSEYGVGPGITVDNLLQMRSGLPDVWNLSLMSGLNPESFTTEELLLLLKDHPEMLHKPGTVFMYCNTNYFLLTKIVEIVAKRASKEGKPPLLRTDQSFVDFIRERVFKPHNMDARCSLDPNCPRTVDGFDSKGDLRATFETQSMVFGAHGIVGPPKDMVEWNAAIARGELGRLLVPPEGVVASRGEKIYCRGLNVCNMGHWRRISHTGDADGYLAEFRRYENLDDPSKTFAFFLATNYENKDDAGEIANGVANALAGEVIEPEKGGEPKSGLVRENLPHVQEEQVRGLFEGDYTCVDFGTDVHVSIKEKEDERGIWQVCINSANPGHHKPLTEPLPFSPRFDKKGDIVWQLPGVGKLEITEDGFVCKGDRIGSIRFRKKS